ncbi:molybdopterin molybdotransferase MoeA [Qipengyuania sp. 1NDH17]|uniref:Molybdopterin molybdenumtransferase n=1 Tax=Qipengyuania polymorpha TaxID=2867234 RepID=A0ABS7J101_9SPHN|nr:molybdopterin molybdotransferase MoeA [Qipengyuania polymorpha]MBX7458412.1 molybdopterin molybdotransferase MoeA [Qipengyuania polymorpha]
MIGFEEASRLLRENVAALPAEPVTIEEAAGRFLAKDLLARFDAPRSNVSAMDGYAVRAGTLENGVPFKVLGQARPGMPFGGEVGVREAVRIFTGAAVPKGADCVVMQEYARAEGDTVSFEEGHGPTRHIRKAGSDFCEGDVLLARGTRLTPRAMVAAAAADRASIEVSIQPRVAIIATGDELVSPGEAHATANAIPESASHGVAALCEAMGGTVVLRLTGRDELGLLTDLASEALATADLVVVTGGASVGDHDLARPMFEALGLELVFAKVAIKPGKPVWLGKVGDKPVLGLPGNPTSAMVTARLFLQPLLAAMQGGEAAANLQFLPMPCAAALPEAGGRETFIRAIATPEGLTPAQNQESGAQAPLAQSDWLIRRPAGSPATARGETVSALAF